MAHEANHSEFYAIGWTDGPSPPAFSMKMMDTSQGSQGLSRLMPEEMAD
jgi:hypothetical protein